MAKEYYDHLGNVFDTFTNMCKFYGKDRGTVQTRLMSGYSLEEALTKSIRKPNIFIGPDGTEYTDLDEICKKHNKKLTLVKDRLRLGWVLDDALEKPVGRGLYVDHLGNEYTRLGDLCKAYNITLAAYKRRKSLNWDLEQILTTPCKITGKREVTDHLGNKYKSIKTMCEAYGVSKTIFMSRRKKGYSVEYSLTKRKIVEHGVESSDHLGNIYDSFRDMCKAYGKRDVLVKHRTDNGGWPLKDALIIPVLRSRIHKSHIGIDNKQYYKIKTYYLNAEQIIEYNKQGLI